MSLRYKFKQSTRFFKYTLLVILCSIGVLIVSTGRFIFFPDLKPLRSENPATTSFIRYREQQWKKQGSPRKVSLRWVPYNRISEHLIKEVVISEDAKFWRHHGFDFAEMKNAARTNLKKKRFKFGASTISQQLVKNLYLKPSKNVFRKLNEAILTWRLERTLSKRRILEIYLNVIEWGDGVFGIGQAARHYFGKSPEALTIEEAARLAVVLPSPLRYNPLSDGGYIERRAAVIMERAFPERKQPARDTIRDAVPDSGSLRESGTDTTAVSAAKEIPDTATEPGSVEESDTARYITDANEVIDVDTALPVGQSVVGDTTAVQ